MSNLESQQPEFIAQIIDVKNDIASLKKMVLARERYQVARIEELEAQLEMQRKTEDIRVLIRLYDDGVIDSEQLHDYMEHLSQKSGSDQYLAQVMEEWNNCCYLTPDHDYDDHINRIRAAIGMREEAGA